MFQSFEVMTRPEQGPPRLAALRAEMAAAGVDIWLVPRADIYQGEYVAPHDARLRWLTGFSGSAGFAVVTAGKAAVFTDGRYKVQVRAETDPVFDRLDMTTTPLEDWLLAEMPQGGKLGFAPWYHTAREVARWRDKLEPKGFVLTPSENLIDRIWADKPAPPPAPFTLHPDDIAGESSAAKRARLGAGLAEAGQGAALLTSPDSIAWLLNIRGSDVPRNPVPHAYALLHASGEVDVFCRPGKGDAVAETLGPDVQMHDAAAIFEGVGAAAGPIRYDPATAPEAVVAHLGPRGTAGADPCLLPKAVKNAAELDGMRAAQLRDGVAMVQFLAWLDAEAPGGGLTEISVVEALEGFRRATNALLDISFETICGAGADGAIIHYRVNEQTDRPVNPGELLLVDSGGQYADGTTDITRTMAVGPVPEGAAEDYTRVLRGMIALSRARFPKGVTGAHLDALARQHLWTVGRDFDHGTGHGVGAYLSVHEGPQRLSRLSDVALLPGMVLSNEPGHYREGLWGIRIENLIAVAPAEELPGGDAGRALLSFETLTYVPFDRRLIDAAQLAPEERAWIDAYHQTCLTRLAPRLDGTPLAWLNAACAPL